MMSAKELHDHIRSQRIKLHSRGLAAPSEIELFERTPAGGELGLSLSFNMDPEKGPFNMTAFQITHLTYLANRSRYE